MRRLLGPSLAMLAAAFVAMPILSAHSMHYSFYDFGLFANLNWNISQSFDLSPFLFGHIQLFAPLELLLSRPFGLYYGPLVVQSLALLGAGLIFRTAPPEGPLSRNMLLLAYLLFFPVWFNNLFDFHFDHLVVPLGMAFFWFALRGRTLSACLTAAAMALVKEPFALCTLGCGLYLILKQRRTAAGLLLALFGLAYFWLAIQVVLPATTAVHVDASATSSQAFSWLGGDAVTAATRIVTSPLEVLAHLFGRQDKLLYLLMLFGALAFVPLASPLELLPGLPLLALSLLSDYANYFGLGHHYTAPLIAPMLVAFALGLPRVHRLARGMRLPGNTTAVIGLSALLLSNIAVSPSPVSRLFWTNKVWRYGWEAYVPSDRDDMIRQALADHLPDDPSLSVSTQNTLVAPAIVQREFVTTFPDGISNPQPFPDFSNPGKKINVLADYVVIDTARPWYLRDSGCQWRTPSATGADWTSCLTDSQRDGFLAAMDQAGELYATVFHENGLLILKRRK